MSKLHNPTYEDVEGEDLITMKEEVISELTKGKGNALDELIDDLCEIERELTLREE